MNPNFSSESGADACWWIDDLDRGLVFLGRRTPPTSRFGVFVNLRHNALECFIADSVDADTAGHIFSNKVDLGFTDVRRYLHLGRIRQADNRLTLAYRCAGFHNEFATTSSTHHVRVDDLAILRGGHGASFDLFFEFRQCFELFIVTGLFVLPLDLCRLNIAFELRQHLFFRVSVEHMKFLLSELQLFDSSIYREFLTLKLQLANQTARDRSFDRIV